MAAVSKKPPVKRIKQAYYSPKEGEWVQPVRRGYRLACCDCGLVHLMNFRTKNGRVQFAAFRAIRQTAAMRRNDHSFLPAEQVDQLAAALLKATKRKSIKVGRYRYRLKKSTS